jgi:sulfide:quinone oxidoreductase
MSAATAPHVVILGAGFGGLELSTRLSEDLGDTVRVTLIDQRDSFVFGFSKLDVMFARLSMDEVRVPYRDIAKTGVEFRQETIESIDPVTKRVVTNGGTYDADIVVIALGADLDPAATPGLAEGGYEFYSSEGAQRAGEALADFSAGVILIGALGPFFKCPPAPFEAAFLLHDRLVEQGVRDASTIQVLTPLPAPVPVSAEVSAGILAGLRDRDIEFSPLTRVTRLDPATQTATVEDGRTLAYDLFLGIPVHVAPAVVTASGLTEDDGWITIDPATFTTKFTDVYAVGDVTSAPVPRAGVFAEGEARTVADVLVARLGDGADAAPYSGKASCYIEFGGGAVGKADMEFLGGGPPHGSFTPPSAAVTAEKAEFGASRRRRWFGTG